MRPIFHRRRNLNRPIQKKVLMSSPASFKDHPWHPMIIPLPIGLWIFSIVTDLMFKYGGGAVWNDVAFYTLAGGLVGALIAALPGFIDLLGLTNPKTKSIAIWHMIINLLAVALYCVNFWLRMHRAPGDNLPIILSAIGVGLIIISGWLGGELVYVRGVAVKQPPDQGI